VPNTRRPPTWKVALAFATVYVLWGSTYIAIKKAIETLPPFTMGAVRFLVAGGLLYAWGRARGASAPKPLELRGALIVGGLLFLGGNGAVMWASQWVPSGLVALLVAVVPLWMVLVHWFWGGGRRPDALLTFGIGWGLLGVGLLVGSDQISGASPKALLGGLGVLLGSLGWALGSVLQRRLPMPASSQLSTAAQMISGGVWLFAAALAKGELRTFDPSQVSATSLIAFFYLMIFGSIVAFSAYTWLLRVSTPARVSTYAYVNPVVALVLGWLIAGERLSMRTAAAAVVILSAVMIISLQGGSRRLPDEDDLEAA
jgi:drug/metabolite transporter (DMT)-like permease